MILQQFPKNIKRHDKTPSQPEWSQPTLKIAKKFACTFNHGTFSKLCRTLDLLCNSIDKAQHSNIGGT